MRRHRGRQAPPPPPPRPSRFVGVATIDEEHFAAHLGMSLTEVREHLTGLEEAGWLRRLPTAPGGSSTWALTFAPGHEDDGL